MAGTSTGTGNEPIHMTLQEVRTYLQTLYSSSSDSSDTKEISCRKKNCVNGAFVATNNNNNNNNNNHKYHARGIGNSQVRFLLCYNLQGVPNSITIKNGNYF